MRKIPSRDEYIYMDCRINMSTKKMSDLLYAVIMTHATIPALFGVGIYDYTRTQNAHNGVNIKVHIHPDFIGEFELLSGVKLEKPKSLNIN